MVRKKSGPKTELHDLRPLSELIGNWNVTLRWSRETHKLIGGPDSVEATAKISLLKEGGFLHYQMGPSHWIIGGDENANEFTVLYSDERPVSRVYKMSFSHEGVWKIWRNAPGFHQRFEGRLKDNGRRIDAHWEKSKDGKSWVPDFEMTFVRRGT
jgi:hypothetical protein